MIVVPQEFVQEPHAALGRARLMDREAFLVERAKEPLDLSVRFRVVGSRPPMLDSQAPAGLLETVCRCE